MTETAIPRRSSTPLSACRRRFARACWNPFKPSWRGAAGVSTRRASSRQRPPRRFTQSRQAAKRRGNTSSASPWDFWGTLVYV